MAGRRNVAQVSRLSLRHSAMFKAINTDDDKLLKPYYMESMVSKTFMKVIGFGASLFLTVFAGLFAMMSVTTLIMSIIEKDLFTVTASVAAAFLACVCWSVRKDVR